MPLLQHVRTSLHYTKREGDGHGLSRCPSERSYSVQKGKHWDLSRAIVSSAKYCSHPWQPDVEIS
jgi:hypothetical protein